MRLSDNIESIFAETEDGVPVTIQTIMDRVSVRSFGILLVVFALPSAVPVPAPGYSIPGGIALLLLGIQIIRRREYPWLPERVLRKEVRIGKRPRLLRWMILFLRIFEFFIRPRLAFVFNNAVTYRVMGLAVTLCGLSLCIPIILTNTAPAFGVFLIGLGMLEEDGFLSSVGVLAGITGLLLTLTVLGAIVFFGMEGAEMVKEFIKGLLDSPDPEATARVFLHILV